MKIDRSFGVLQHITSLPGKGGIGTLGDEAYRFADFLHSAGASCWQILPLGPVSMVHACSPYTSASTFAGNWHLISVKKLSEEVWFRGKFKAPELPEKHQVDYQKAIDLKLPILRQCSEEFFSNAEESEILSFENFCSREAYWLDDFVLFSVLSDEYGTDDWQQWPAPLSDAAQYALDEAAVKFKQEIIFEKFLQYIFFSQWGKLKKYCNKLGIKMIGDIPIYVSLEGTDAWSHREIFQLDDKTGRPGAVSGVPPDYFSETGQRWGNPLYRWLNRDNSLNDITFSWWKRRINHLVELVDLLRIDHFRGFESYWAIPADEPTAIEGKWIPGPGVLFFDRLREELGDLPLIAEDLGIITRQVENLRDRYDLPGMKILQFAFDWNNKNSYLPHNITNKNCILYTGTHDNNTTNGWFYEEGINKETQKYIMEYLGTDNFSDVHWQLIRAAFRTIADMVIIPMQDILGFGSEFRMNTPGTVEGNWLWKVTSNDITPALAEKLRKLGEMYNRLPARSH